MNTETIDPAKLSEMSNEELIQAFEMLSVQEEEAAGGKSEIRQLFRARLEELKRKDLVVGDFIVAKSDSVRFSTKLADAKELGAVMTKIVNDNTKLRKLHDGGVKVPGVIETKTVRITRATK